MRRDERAHGAGEGRVGKRLRAEPFDQFLCEVANEWGCFESELKWRAEAYDIAKLKAYFWLKAEKNLADEFGRLPTPVLPETLEGWLGHPLAQGLEGDEMMLMREWLEELRGAAVVTKRADGTPRVRKLPPPPKPNPKLKRGQRA